jgi:hypothetical protein
MGLVRSLVVLLLLNFLPLQQHGHALLALQK